MSTVAQYLVEQMAAWGVRRVYGVVGDTYLPLMDALDSHSTVRFVTVRHEAAAGFMASAEAKLTGRLGVCLATSGPGIANLINGLCDAWADGAPVLAITGQVERAKIGTDTKQYIDQQSMISPVAGYTALLSHEEAAGQVIPAAMRAALAGGTVGHVSIPKDLFGRDCAARVIGPEPYLGTPPTAATGALSTARGMMQAARKPLILVGQGGRNARRSIMALAERWGAGLIHSMPAKGVISWQHPLALGGLGAGGTESAHHALNEADLLLMLGCNWWPQGYVPTEIPIIKVDKVPANIGGKAPVQCGIAGDIGEVVPALERALEGLSKTAVNAWTERLASLKREWERQLVREVAQVGPPLSPQCVVRALEQALPSNAIVTLDTGDHTVWFNRIFGGDHHDLLVSGNWRSLGFGLPAALAAKLAEPTRQVAAFVGDGGLQSLLGELVTAAELDIPVLIVVVNNGGMAIEHNRAVASGLSPLGTTPRNPDFVALARGCGVTATKAVTLSDLQDGLAKAVGHSGPFLVEVITAPLVAPTAGG